MSDDGRAYGRHTGARRADDDRPDAVDHPTPTGPAGLLALQQLAGNRAVAGAVADPRHTTPTGGPVVQRYAFVRDKQVIPSHPSLTPAMTAMAADTTVRDYQDGGEFADHAASRTDHIGTLRSPASPGTWVRFPRTGSNLLGENHTKVTLEHVVAAVGSKNFIYEPLAIDDLSALPAMKAAYEKETADRLARMGVAGAPDTRKFGSESLFPKLGFSLTAILPMLWQRNIAALKPAGYIGQPAQRYLKIAWGYGKDVPAEIATLKAARKRVPPELRRLAATCKRLAPTLDPFITALPVDGFLGDALDTPASKKIIPDLISFCEDLVNAMGARISADTVLTPAEKKKLEAMPQAKVGQMGAMFAVWRDMEFSHAVRAAVARGVRYAGMGLLHLVALRAEGLPPGSQGFDMDSLDITAFETRTQDLAAKAKPSP